MHLFADISSHGLGHLAIAAPVLDALADRLPGLRLTIRSQIGKEKLKERIRTPFEHIGAASDFGFVMVNALSVDREASAKAYRAAHQSWQSKVDGEALFLRDLKAHCVLTDVSYLPLAGAARAGIPAASLCSINWADLFQHFFGEEPWAAPIHGEMLAAYRSARGFLRTTPGMPMADLDNLLPVGPIARPGKQHDLPLGKEVRSVLVAMGGINHRLPIENWPRLANLRWLVPGAWEVKHPDAVPFETLGLSFTDLLCSVDAVLTKPGYGTFVEAACDRVPVLYQRRVDWPEQDCLIDWLSEAGRCQEIDDAQLESGEVGKALESLWAQPAKPPVECNGAAEAAVFLEQLLKEACSQTV